MRWIIDSKGELQAKAAETYREQLERERVWRGESDPKPEAEPLRTGQYL